MNLDDLAGTAVLELRRTATSGLDPDDMLRRLHQARRRRAGTVLALVLLVAGLVGATALVTRNQTVLPADSPNSQLPAGLCAEPRVTCLEGRTLRIELRTPVVAKLPARFQDEALVDARRAVEFYRSDAPTTGVTLFEDAVPVRYDDSLRRDPKAGTTARSMARWLSNRPFLRDTTVTRRTIGGRPVWQVTGDIRPNAELPTRRGNDMRAATFFSHHSVAGAAPILVGSYTLADQDYGGVTVVWSWHYGLDRPSLAGNDAFVDDLLNP